MRKYVEDLKREPNPDIGPKDIFEIASQNRQVRIQRRYQIFGMNLKNGKEDTNGES